MVTQETQAAAVANQVIALTSALQGIAVQISAVSTQWTNLSVANMLNAFPTAPLLSTGALGTADGSPVNTHPVDIRTADGGLITRAVSAANISSMLTFLQGVQQAINGSAVSANGAAAQLLALAQ